MISRSRCEATARSRSRQFLAQWLADDDLVAHVWHPGRIDPSDGPGHALRDVERDISLSRATNMCSIVTDETLVSTVRTDRSGATAKVGGEDATHLSPEPQGLRPVTRQRRYSERRR